MTTDASPAPLRATTAPHFRPLAERLATACGTTATLADGAWRIPFERGELRIDRAGLHAPGLSVTSDATWRISDDTLAARFVAVARGLGHDTFPVRWLGTPFGRRRAREALERVTREAADEGLVVRATEDRLLLLENRAGWRTTYSYDSWEEPMAELAGTALPAGDAGTALVRELVDVLRDRRVLPVSTGGTCRFCGSSFAPHEFLSDRQCCHGCATTHLGVVF